MAAIKFTYEGYLELLDLLGKKEYEVTGYRDWKRHDRCVILRHDVDCDLQKALEFARLEHRLGVRSTYFVLLTSNFYNPNSCRNRRILAEIQDMGHTVGLHFDEMAYPDDTGIPDRISNDIEDEMKKLSDILGKRVDVFSYHRPTREILDSEINMHGGGINSYSNIFFRQFKYLSDSRMHWREPVLDIVKSGNFERLHILTHPFWYHDEEKSMREVLSDFINRAGTERYSDLDDNFTNLGDVMEMGGVSI